MGPLAGVKVIEISGIGPGPFCGMLLADLGATVIAVEPPERLAAPERPHAITSRGKQSVVLNLKHPVAVEAVLRLCEGADLLIEGMRPGVMERLGLGPEVCLQRRPALVYGRMTGWGQDGPWAPRAGHDSNYTALSGALWFASPPDQPPMAPSTVLGDVAGGALYLAVGLLAALQHARSTGQGQVVDAAIVDGAAHMLNLMLGAIQRRGGSFARGTQAFDGSHWAAQSFRCKDGGWINFAPLEPRFYAELLARLGLSGDARFVRGQNDPALWPELRQAMAALISSRTRAEWEACLEGSDACWAPVLAPDEAAPHPHLASRQIYVEHGGVLQASPAPRFSATPVAMRDIAPAGTHTRQILGALDFTPDNLEELLSSQHA
ncbi:Alpha-methylacyl-CoA racemase [Cupriavidus taiwanensis]|uniref:CaiB/BaiF CoA transferase family protein n=1 Tax=Cupriavidus taiwanensis TaxID=164546 RepID=UPI000E14A04D|nr:CaiB/BaiF CoA-transferase family protein [Cupriavidus taiwanensis]SOZ19324.1 Alpha-methylacyl-CoA racemase [Cupriavidus taiwanensis]SOZ32520.1 Alpha-methylacyl-CoA racemase [Cupriavidus taiwanensis]SOZ48100.1 Alpha-methylacyl-CoA racemase [Cupriavidus taiwanensis]